MWNCIKGSSQNWPKDKESNKPVPPKKEIFIDNQIK